MKQMVEIEIKGTFGFGVVSVCKTPIPLNMNFKGSHEVVLTPPTITVGYHIKGGETDSYDISVTINKVTKHILGNVGSTGEDNKSKGFTFDDFNLSTQS